MSNTELFDAEPEGEVEVEIEVEVASSYSVHWYAKLLELLPSAELICSSAEPAMRTKLLARLCDPRLNKTATMLPNDAYEPVVWRVHRKHFRTKYTPAEYIKRGLLLPSEVLPGLIAGLETRLFETLEFWVAADGETLAVGINKSTEPHGGIDPYCIVQWRESGECNTLERIESVEREARRMDRRKLRLWWPLFSLGCIVTCELLLANLHFHTLWLLLVSLTSGALTLRAYFLIVRTLAARRDRNAW